LHLRESCLRGWRHCAVREGGGRWRRIYAHLAGAGAAYTFGSLLVNLSIYRGVYSTGSLYDLPIIASLLWLGTAGVTAYSSGSETSTGETKETEEKSSGSAPRSEAVWTSRLARAALLSLPLLGIWCVKTSQAPMAVREFRILVTLTAVLPMGFLVFLRYELINAERLRLLRASQESIDNLKRLQMQFVQSEKLASLGQLAAGAAHEINNPLTASWLFRSADRRSCGWRAPSQTRGKNSRPSAPHEDAGEQPAQLAHQVPSEQRSCRRQYRRHQLGAAPASGSSRKNIRIELQTGAPFPRSAATRINCCRSSSTSSITPWMHWRK